MTHGSGLPLPCVGPGVGPSVAPEPPAVEDGALPARAGPAAVVVPPACPGGPVAEVPGAVAEGPPTPAPLTLTTTGGSAGAASIHVSTALPVPALSGDDLRLALQPR